MNPYHVKGYQYFAESLQYWMKECITDLQLPDVIIFLFLVRSRLQIVGWTHFVGDTFQTLSGESAHIDKRIVENWKQYLLKITRGYDPWNF